MTKEFNELWNKAFFHETSFFEKKELTENGYSLMIGLPGAEKEDLEIQFDGRYLTVKSKKELPFHGNLNLKYFTSKLDFEEIEAEMKAGVLSILMKTKKVKKEKLITIK